MKKPLHATEPGSRAAADDLAAAALTFLAVDPERLDRFFAVTSATPAGLRRAAAEPGFVGSLLDYLATDERLYLAFARANGYDPQEVEAIRMSLAPPPET